MSMNGILYTQGSSQYLEVILSCSISLNPSENTTDPAPQIDLTHSCPNPSPGHHHLSPRPPQQSPPNLAFSLILLNSHSDLLQNAYWIRELPCLKNLQYLVLKIISKLLSMAYNTLHVPAQLLPSHHLQLSPLVLTVELHWCLLVAKTNHILSCLQTLACAVLWNWKSFSLALHMPGFFSFYKS